MALTATAFSAQAQTTNICDRTQQVQDEILRRTSTDGDTCESVSESEMAKINFLDHQFVLANKGITALKPGDFDGLSRLDQLELRNNNLTELPDGIFSSLLKLEALYLIGNSLRSLSSDVFSGLPNLAAIFLNSNQLEALPDNIFSGVTGLNNLRLADNPGTPFKLTVRFEPETLEEDFGTAPVRVVLREGAPRRVTVPLSVIGGSLISGAPDSLTLAAGSTQSENVMVIKGQRYFRLAQGKLELSGENSRFTGFEIIQGPPVTLGGIPVRVKVFLEGALE